MHKPFNTGKIWTKEEDKQVRDLLAKDASYRDIAKQLQRTTAAVSQHASEIGLCRPRPAKTNGKAHVEVSLRDQLQTLRQRALDLAVDIEAITNKLDHPEGRTS